MIHGKGILITGAAGLIGSALYAAVEHGNFMRGENRTSARGSLMLAPDYIIHAAGYASPSRFMADPMGAIAVNTTRLMELIAGMKPGARLLYLSSSEVYSGCDEPPPYTEYNIGTTTPQHPRAAYIEGKRCGEAICHAARAAGKDVVIARVSSVYGPGFKRDDTRVLPQFIRMAVEDEHVRPAGSGHNRRAWLYVKDCADMLLTILERGTQEVYNVGGTEECSILEMAQTIAEQDGCSYQMPQHSGDASAPSCVRLDMSRYNDEFGKPALTSLRCGLSETLDWYRRTYA